VASTSLQKIQQLTLWAEPTRPMRLILPGGKRGDMILLRFWIVPFIDGDARRMCYRAMKLK
jgi:hypothetical protein